MIFRSLGALVAGVAVGAAFVATDASAATSRSHWVTATAVCASPLPVYDATLRKGPLGIRNTGTDPIFVSCSVPVDYATDQTGVIVQVTLRSFGAAATVNCTLTAGSRYGSASGSIAYSTAVPASPSDTYVSMTDVDRKAYYGSFNFSCILPRDVEMGTIWFYETSAGDAL